MGANAFCLKVCDPSKPHAPDYCQHIYDRIGCTYNAPNNAVKGEFTSCDGDNQDFPGIYTDASGAVQTYTQPPESLGAIRSMPYQPKVPASSNCVTYTSAALYAAAATVAPSSSNSGKSVSHSGSTTHSGSAAGRTAAGDSSPNSASGLVTTSVSSVLGVALAVALFA
jgi:hypothetical protein